MNTFKCCVFNYTKLNNVAVICYNEGLTSPDCLCLMYDHSIVLDLNYAIHIVVSPN